MYSPNHYSAFIDQSGTPNNFPTNHRRPRTGDNIIFALRGDPTKTLKC